MTFDPSNWTDITSLSDLNEGDNGFQFGAGGGVYEISAQPTTTSGGDGQQGIRHSLIQHQGYSAGVDIPHKSYSQGRFSWGGQPFDPSNNGTLLINAHFCTRVPDRNVSIVHGHLFVDGASRFGFWLRVADGSLPVDERVTYYGNGAESTPWTAAELGVPDPANSFCQFRIYKINQTWDAYLFRTDGSKIQLGHTVRGLGEADFDEDLQLELKISARSGTYEILARFDDARIVELT